LSYRISIASLVPSFMSISSNISFSSLTVPDSEEGGFDGMILLPASAMAVFDI